MKTYPKSVSEQFPLGVDFEGRLPDGVSLASATATAIDLTDDSNATELILDDDQALIVGNEARVFVLGGIDLHDYEITVLGFGDDSPPTKLREQFIVSVDNKPRA